MDFNEIPYVKPNIKLIENSFNELIVKFDSAVCFEDADKAMESINSLRQDFETMAEIVSIRNTIDTTNKFYEEAQNYFDENTPIYQGLISNYYNSLVKSKYKDELENKWGKQIFTIAKLTLKTFSPEIIDDLKDENKLITEYTALLASAKIMFEGEERNLSQLVPYQQSTNRVVRKKACEAKFNFFKENEEKLDDIYDKLVKTRTKIAEKLGYENFVQLGYDRLCRSDYNADMVATFRKGVKKYIVPIATKLKERQRERLGLSTLMYYDDKYNFKSGNATPKGNPQSIINSAVHMYSELSPETKDFFDFMVDNNLLDLESKKGKAGGGYTTYISKYKAPFIFSNFNGTSHDVVVLTHEAGHAFQVYCSRNYALPEYNFPTMEACEIHSMSMEFFTWPWMKLFFKDDVDKFKFSHLSGALTFIPYGVTVDEFQHFVYSNPTATPEERKKKWREIEKEYLPYTNYDGNDFLERGGFWFQQMHIFQMPFYYIDYTLAQICALEFWKKSREDNETAWTDYLRLCKQGGSTSFLELLKIANLISPFDESCIQSVIGEIDKWLNSIDDTKF